jgi:hypothetical protein
MAAVTGTIVALGGLGVSAAQAIGQNKAMKKAQAASDLASKELKAINEQNAFKQLQVPTLGTQLAQQSQAQRESQAVNMLQGAGAEGVIGGIGQLAVAGEQGDLQNAARLDELKFERDAMQSQAQQGINSRKQQRDFEIGFGEKSDAEAKRAQAEANRNAAIESAVGFAGSALTSASKLVGPYGNKNLGQGELGKTQWSPEQFAKFGNVGKDGGVGLGETTDLDFESIGGMSNQKFKQFMKGLTSGQKQMLFNQQ